MLDQLDNLNYYNLNDFRSLFVPRTCFLNPCFIFSKNLILSLVDKAATGT